jgi:hypothetical protein
LTLRAAFQLPLRRTEGLVGSIIHLLGGGGKTTRSRDIVTAKQL